MFAKTKSILNRVDSRLRECDNYAFFAILAQNFKFPALLFPHCAEIWRISGNLVRISGHSVYISVSLISSIRPLSAHVRY